MLPQHVESWYNKTELGALDTVTVPASLIVLRGTTRKSLTVLYLIHVNTTC